jgi:hypothetical protein
MAIPAPSLRLLGVLVVTSLGSPSLDASEHWSYQPLRKNDPPKLAAHPVDGFINARLKARLLEATPEAPPRSLIRRVTFDLIGLPPSPSEITQFEESFAANPGAAWQTLVDRLLASPHYGERWGRHWLDLVRYADTAGDAADFPVPEAYKYRNYVLDAFNKDKPYDQFIREQIAGDLLPFENDEQRWEQTIATGYVAISRRIGVSPQNLPHITIEDTLDNLGKTFLGLTIGCARCHDHKFDEISAHDYYALYGFFESSIYPHPGAEHKPHREHFVYRMGRKQSDHLLKKHRSELAKWDRKERAQFALYKSFQTRNITDASLSRESTWAELERIRAEQAQIAASFPRMEIAYALSEGTGHEVAIQKQGSPAKRDRGELAPRRFLTVLGGQILPADVKGSGREHLADWIASPENPLPARVMVNRLWQHHFGVGLVRTASDFGVRGTPPTHPELLDYLARRFMECGWSIKAMHRLIVTSAAYRRSSENLAPSSAIDPENNFRWRANRRRLDAEQLRDSILSFSAQLDLSPGHRHPFPHHLTYFFRQHEPFQDIYPSKKRSVYLMQQRIQKSPWLDLFDGPDGNTPVEHRNESTTALQALYFMNSAFAHEQADAIATRALKGTADPSQRLQGLYETIFNRPPTARDATQAKAHLASVQNTLKQSEHRAWSGLIRGMISSNEFIYLD